MLKYLNKLLLLFLCLLLIMSASLIFLFLHLSFAEEMVPKLSKDSLQTALARHRAQAAQGGAPVATSKPTGDSSETASDSSPLIIKQGKKRASVEVVELETTSACQATPPTIADALGFLLEISSSLERIFHIPPSI